MLEGKGKQKYRVGGGHSEFFLNVNIWLKTPKILFPATCNKMLRITLIL